MQRAWVCLLFLVSGCAHEAAELAEPVTVAEAPVSLGDEGRDFAARVEGPARCEEMARALLSVAPDEAWRQLWCCVQRGRFTALRNVLQGAWDRELQTRPDAPALVARVIAERGGDVDSDLRLVHERRVPLFGLGQALARPDAFRGAFVIVRARVSPQGVLDETRLVAQSWDLQLGLTEREVVRAAPPFGSDVRRRYTSPRAFNLDVVTGTRAVAVVHDPFLDADNAVVVLGRFEGLRDSDAWPVVSVLDHFRPSATVAY